MEKEEAKQKMGACLRTIIKAAREMTEAENDFISDIDLENDAEAESPAPPLRDMTKTVSKECDTCAGEERCSLDRHFTGKCSFKIPPVATESEKKEVADDRAVIPMVCGNCKNAATSRFHEPCPSCINVDNKPNWEPIPAKQKVPEEKLCEDCGFALNKNCYQEDCNDNSLWKPKPESEANMDFSNALKALKMGNPVKRVGWQKNIYVFLEPWREDDFKMSVNMRGTEIPFSPKVSELEATDWMLHID